VKLHKKKTAKTICWFATAGGVTRFDDIARVPFKQARQAFREAIANLGDEAGARKSKGLSCSLSPQSAPPAWSARATKSPLRTE
jgi:hypothetical protein